MENKRYILEVSTHWCGEDQQYGVITDSECNKDLISMGEMLAYDNYSSFGGYEEVLNDLFPEGPEDGVDYSEEQHTEANEAESGYYDWGLSEFEGTDEEFKEYELIFDYRSR